MPEKKYIVLDLDYTLLDTAQQIKDIKAALKENGLSSTNIVENIDNPKVQKILGDTEKYFYPEVSNLLKEIGGEKILLTKAGYHPLAFKYQKNKIRNINHLFDQVIIVKDANEKVEKIREFSQLGEVIVLNDNPKENDLILKELSGIVNLMVVKNNEYGWGRPIQKVLKNLL